MLSIRDIHQRLNAACGYEKYTEDEAARLRDGLYSIARIMTLVPCLNLNEFEKHSRTAASPAKNKAEATASQARRS